MDSSVIIGLLARDCQDSLIRNIPKIERLCSFFADYHVVAVENDSVDGTRELLHDWAIRNPKVIVDSFEDHSQRLADSSYARIAHMVYLRNRLMGHIGSLRAPDIVVMMDIDVYDFDVDGMMDGITHAPYDWGALFANGRSMLPNHHYVRSQYDQYAIMAYDEEWCDMTIKKFTPHRQLRRGMVLDKAVQRSDYYPVKSAFGGIGIYRYEAIKDLKYKTVMINERCQKAFCEHVPFHLEIIQQGYKNYVCQSLVVNYGIVNVKPWVAFLMYNLPQVYEKLFYLDQCIRKTQ